MVSSGPWLEKFITFAHNLTVNDLFWINLLFEIEIYKLIDFFYGSCFVMNGLKRAVAASATVASVAAAILGSLLCFSGI